LRATVDRSRRVAFHASCTLQHGQKLAGLVERIPSDVGLPLAPVPDGHLCCGSAGTCAILQKRLSQQLRDDELEALESGRPAGIATANIGCLHHLQVAASAPMVHWIGLLDPAERSDNPQ
jgi:glycolate oxidase iron-sulfur subunit